MRGLAYAGQHSDAVFGNGLARRAALRPRAEVAPARRRARRRASRSTGSTTSRASPTTIKRGEYKQRFTLARNGLLSTVPTVPA